MSGAALRSGTQLAVRTLLDDGEATILSLRSEPIPYRRYLGRRTVVRLEGEAHSRGAVRSFRLVSKAFEGGGTEERAYASGLLSRLRAPLRSPRLLHAEANGTATRLWLEHGPDHRGGRWLLPRCERFARGLGSMAVDFAGTPIDLPAVSYHADAPAWAATLTLAERAAAHPETAAPWYSPGDLTRIVRVLGARPSLLAQAAKGSRTLCHGDCGAHNVLVAYPDETGQAFWLIDWESAAIGPIGTDLAAFVNGSLITGAVPADDAADLDAAAWESYAAGLGGGAERAGRVRRSYLTHATLRWGSHVHALGPLLDPDRRASFEHHWGRPFPEVMSERAALTRLFLDRAERLLGPS